MVSYLIQMFSATGPRSFRSEEARSYRDDSQKSVQHVADYEQGRVFNIVFQVPVELGMASLPRSPPALFAGACYAHAQHSMPPGFLV